MTKTYALTTQHAELSHGIPVFVDDDGRALGAQDVGIWGCLQTIAAVSILAKRCTGLATPARLPK